MKKISKILAVVLTLIMLLSTASLVACAEPNMNINSWAIKECSVFDGDTLKIDKTVNINKGDTYTLDGIEGCEILDASVISDNFSGIEFNYSEKDDHINADSFTAVEYGVYVLTIFGYKYEEVKDGDMSFWDYVPREEYTLVVVVQDPDGMGEVTAITANNETFRYREGKDYIPCAHPDVETKGEQTYYTVIYVPEKYGESGVYLDGSVDTGLIDSSNCTVYVFDAAGHIFQDTCTITIKYVWWQWLINICLLGFLWY